MRGDGLGVSIVDAVSGGSIGPRGEPDCVGDCRIKDWDDVGGGVVGHGGSERSEQDELGREHGIGELDNTGEGPRDVGIQWIVEGGADGMQRKGLGVRNVHSV
mmetsp:Transcript_29238/g.45807  ORF Transcript_29238/g.45807 Transcript_29238/m.45807 type:complete len:103 (+) Transcript_29238:1471-1779(+)